MCHVQLIENIELELFMLVIIAGHKLIQCSQYNPIYFPIWIYCPIDRSTKVINVLIQDANVFFVGSLLSSITFE